MVFGNNIPFTGKKNPLIYLICLFWVFCNNKFNILVTFCNCLKKIINNYKIILCNTDNKSILKLTMIIILRMHSCEPKN